MLFQCSFLHMLQYRFLQLKRSNFLPDMQLCIQHCLKSSHFVPVTYFLGDEVTFAGEMPMSHRESHGGLVSLDVVTAWKVDLACWQLKICMSGALSSGRTSAAAVPGTIECASVQKW